MAPQCRRLEGKFALITGASRGIGRAVAVRFAEEGAAVAINYAGSETAARETLEQARAAARAGGYSAERHCIVKADVSDPAAIAAMFERVLRGGQRLDILVNNAGIQAPAPSHEAPLAEYRHILDVNLTGALLCAQAAIRHFLSRPGGGVILNCSSVHEIIPKPAYIAYSVSKGGLGNLTRTLALEYADRGIRVNGVGPGATLTDMHLVQGLEGGHDHHEQRQQIHCGEHDQRRVDQDAPEPRRPDDGGFDASGHVRSPSVRNIDRAR